MIEMDVVSLNFMQHWTSLEELQAFKLPPKEPMCTDKVSSSDSHTRLEFSRTYQPRDDGQERLNKQKPDMQLQDPYLYLSIRHERPPPNLHSSFIISFNWYLLLLIGEPQGELLR